MEENNFPSYAERLKKNHYDYGVCGLKELYDEKEKLDKKCLKLVEYIQKSKVRKKKKSISIFHILIIFS